MKNGKMLWLIHYYGFFRLFRFILLALSPFHFFVRFSHAIEFLLPLDELVLTLSCHVPPLISFGSIHKFQHIVYGDSALLFPDTSQPRLERD